MRPGSGSGGTFTGRGRMTPVEPITFAHRGARLEEPENTLAAFRRALTAGARGLESDAWLSADGEVVLVHDGTVGKLLRRRKVPESTAEELAEFGVPRLADVYAELGTVYEFSIDVKDHDVIDPMLEVAEAAGAIERLWVCTPTVGHLAVPPGDDHGPARALAAPRAHPHAPRTPCLRPEQSRHRRDEHAPHRLERRPGRAVPPFRCARRSPGTCRKSATSGRCCA